MNLHQQHTATQAHPLAAQIEQIIQNIPRNLRVNSQNLCYAMSDMMHKLLRDQGIDSCLVECELTAFGTNPPRIFYVGSRGAAHSEDTLDTHVICMVQHETPLLIDLSIPKVLPEGYSYIMGVAEGEGSVIARFEHDDLVYQYKQHDSQRFQEVYQKSIVQRVSTDAQVFRNLKRLYWLCAVLSLICVVSFATAVWWRVGISLELKDQFIQQLRMEQVVKDNHRLLQQLMDEQYDTVKKPKNGSVPKN